jgi:Transposase
MGTVSRWPGRCRSGIGVTFAVARGSRGWNSGSGCKWSAIWTCGASRVSGSISRRFNAASAVIIASRSWPFKRKDVSYTYRFEEHVLRTLIGSNETETARRLGISAETVAHIVHLQLTDAKDKEIDPERVITHVGLDELSLKKRHKLYVTLLTDLSDPQRPRILAVAPGRDEAAGRQCLEKLSASQREQVQTYRVDMGAAYNKVGKQLLPNARAVIDRFHVAQKFGEAVDAERKKNHAGLQGEADQGRAEGVSRFDVGVSAGPAGLDARGDGPLGGLVRAAATTAETAPSPRTLQGDFRHHPEPQEGGAAIDRLAGADYGRRLRLERFLRDL